MSSSPDLKTRISEVYNYYNKRGTVSSQNEFAARWGVSKNGMSNWMNNISQPTSDMWAKFAESFPEINLDYMITGKGTMLKGKEEYAAYVHGASATAEPLEDYYANTHVIKTAQELLQGFDLFWERKEELRSLISAKLQG